MRVGAGWVSTVLQRLVVSLWSDPGVAAAVVAAGREYDRRREAVRAALSARGVPARGRTGINVWVPVPDETRAVAVLRDAGYAVAAGALYRLGAAPAIRITVSPLADVDIGALADAVAAAVGPGPATPGA
jgi:DNA-binding transcriptional MocR family regulator